MGKFSYIHTIRKQYGGQMIEVKTPLTHRDYSHLLDQQVLCDYSILIDFKMTSPRIPFI